MEYLDSLIQIDKKINSLLNTKKTIEKKMVEKEHPLRIGDIIKCNGYSYTGREIKISNLFIRKFLGEYQWKATGYLVRKDGTTSKQKGSWTQTIKGGN